MKGLFLFLVLSDILFSDSEGVDATEDRAWFYLLLLILSLIVNLLLALKIVKQKKEIAHVNTLDALTKTYTGEKITQVLNIEYDRNRRYGGVFCVLMITIDNFREINDELGYSFGDMILQKVASVLKESIRHSDVIGKRGGEDFMIICPGTDRQKGLIAAMKLKESITEVYKSDRVMPKICIGISEFIQDDPTPNEVINRANEALKKARKEEKKVAYL